MENIDLADAALLDADQKELVNHLNWVETEEREKRQIVKRVQEAYKELEELEIQRKILTNKMRKIMAEVVRVWLLTLTVF